MDPYLSKDQLAKMSAYKHSAEKTTMETFYVEKLLVPIEKYMFPSSWSANTITLVGQTPMFLYLLYLWYS
jgi:hypothetical protein